jgi:diguanylate cyclase (GGDEF)-like protein
MAIIAFFNENITLAIVLGFASWIYILGYYSIKINNNLTLSSSIVLYSLYCLMFYLTYNGGVSNTGPLWIFIVAPVSVFVHGLKRGMVDLLFFILIICCILYFPQNIISHAFYTSEFKFRLILSFLTVTFLSALYEYSRLQSYKYILELSKEYQKLARFDPLTNLSNRRDALNVLESEKNKITQTDNVVAIILCDIDYFKKINDRYGHSLGDKTLTELSDIFTHLIRKEDCVARWGGEEFLFILPETSARNAYKMAEKIQSSLKEHNITFNNEPIKVTVSMGISQLDNKNSIDQAINLADKYLYEAKNAGRNEIFPKFN